LLLPTPEELVDLSGNVESTDPMLPDAAQRDGISFTDMSVHFDLAAALEELAAARARWMEAGIRDYRLSYDRHCFCIASGPVEAEVRDGIAVSVVTQLGEGDPASAPVASTVEQLFDIIERIFVGSAHRHQVSYRTDGVPTDISTDRDLSGADDELSIRNIRIEVLP
jgi:hypothetical protein